MGIKVHKRKKESRMHGRNMGTHGGGCRKNRKGSGHRGGVGMAGTGKRADQKKTLVLKLYGNDYFGKQGITSKKTERDKRLRINLKDIQDNKKRYLKEEKGKLVVDLKGYKILGDGNLNEKFVIKADEFSKSALDKIKKSGGEAVILKVKKEDLKEDKVEKKKKE